MLYNNNAIGASPYRLRQWCPNCAADFVTTIHYNYYYYCNIYKYIIRYEFLFLFTLPPRSRIRVSILQKRLSYAKPLFVVRYNKQRLFVCCLYMPGGDHYPMAG